MEAYPLIMLCFALGLVLLLLFDTLCRHGIYTLSSRLKGVMNRGGLELCLFFAGFFLFYGLNNGNYVYYNNYSYFADALLHGRLYVDGMPEYLESVVFGGHTYMHFAPGPSLLCLPFVAIWGVNGFNIAYLSMVLGGLNGVLFFRLLKNLAVGRNDYERLWCSFFAIFGTVHCFLAAVGHSWFLGHVSGWFFLLLGMGLLTRKGGKPGLNLFLAGLFYGLSVCCRMSNLPGALFFFAYILLNRDKKAWGKSLLLYCLGAAVFGGMYMALNLTRYGTIMDQGYSLTHLKDKFRSLYDQLQLLPKEQQLGFLKECEKSVGGPLSLKSIPYNLYSIFLLPPDFTKEYPYIIPTLAGVSLSCLSPALYFAIRAEYRKKPLNLAILASMVCCALPFLMNYGNGFAQFGMRYAMDFLPYALLLASMGLVRKPINGWKKALICLCMLLNIWGPVYWNRFYL